jgi:hypothetical protein
MTKGGKHRFKFPSVKIVRSNPVIKQVPEDHQTGGITRGFVQEGPEMFDSCGPGRMQMEVTDGPELIDVVAISDGIFQTE